MCLEPSRNHFAINYFQTYAGFQLQGRNLKHTIAASDLTGGDVAILTSLAFMCQDNSSPEPLVRTLKWVELFTLLSAWKGRSVLIDNPVGRHHC